MDKVISHDEFLKHKDNMDRYLKNLFDKIPKLNVYFPISLNSEERHLIYTNSKGYLYEKLHKIGSKYSIKLWKPTEDGMNSIIEEKYEDCVTEEEEEEEEEYNFKEYLAEISNVLEKQHDMMFNELQMCRRGVNRLGCILTFIMAFNFAGSVLFLTQSINLTVPLPMLDTITDF